MVNRSLEEWLHPVHISDEAREARTLNITQRLSIAIDVAVALDYLHHDCPIPVVHCDLKPSNVLLDGDMTAYVSDFGLARLCPETYHQLSSDQSSSVSIKGTIGYAAPGNIHRIFHYSLILIFSLLSHCQLIYIDSFIFIKEIFST